MIVGIHRILFPTDFSEPARHAQQYAKMLVERLGAELHLLHVVPNLAMPQPEASWSMSDAEQKWHVESANRRLPEEVGSQWSKEHRTVCAVRIGYTVDEIVKYAKDNAIDLIVIGTHGMTGLSRLLLGSVTEKVVRVATCPVLTVHPAESSLDRDP